MKRPVLLLLALLFAQLALGRPARAVDHPMDSLSGGEIERAIGVLRTEGKIDTQTRFPMIRLSEMAKADVLKWTKGDPIPRAAEVFAQMGSEVYLAIIDLDEGRTTSWGEITNGKPPFMLSEAFAMIGMVMADERWKAAMERRGITDLQTVVVLPFTTGFYGDEAEGGKKLYRLGSYYPHDAKNYWGRAIEGVTALVDVYAGEVIDVIDTGVKPMPTGPVDYDAESNQPLRTPPNPITYTQEGGPSYTFDGNVVKWDKWSFHLSFEPQSGLVLSNVSYDGRSVLYQAAVSELFVPYMDPDVHWFFRTYMDAGEYGLGNTSVPALPGIDCPPSATLLSPVLANEAGKPQVLKNAIAIYERYCGDPAWRHTDFLSGQADGVRAQKLVVRTISTVGNYDYLFDWTFDTIGGINVRVGATGICTSKAVDSENATEDTEGNDGRYGRFVGDHTVAVNHDHYIAYRLDFDIDGQNNSFMKDALKPIRIGDESPRTSVWKVESSIATTENDAKLVVDQRHPVHWRVISNSRTNANGYPTSFHITPTTTNFISLLAEDDWPQKRAGFSEHNLYVTPYRRDERYAGGLFPNQSRGDEGLHVWSAADRPIENTDLVVWYTQGFHHVVRAEDWPVMPTAWHGFYLRPFDFLDRNPLMNVPR